MATTIVLKESFKLILSIIILILLAVLPVSISQGGVHRDHRGEWNMASEEGPVYLLLLPNHVEFGKELIWTAEERPAASLRPVHGRKSTPAGIWRNYGGYCIQYSQWLTVSKNVWSPQIAIHQLVFSRSVTQNNTTDKMGNIK